MCLVVVSITRDRSLTLGLPAIEAVLLALSLVATVAEKGMSFPWVRTSPQRIDSVDRVIEILEASW